jgi:hypothetical protein
MATKLIVAGCCLSFLVHGDAKYPLTVSRGNVKEGLRVGVLLNDQLSMQKQVHIPGLYEVLMR